MKANLPQNEPKILERWEQSRLYERIREARKGAATYVLHDGPPYANGPIHLGHALNKCLKDFVVKSKNMAGFDAPYIPGWDCHGLPIEIKVDQKLGGKKLQMKALDVRLECRKYAQKYLDLQREQFKRIGVLGRFDKPYSTMTPEYESVVLATFYKFFEQGFVYKGLRPVYWCWHDRTALAEAEVEYENDTTPAVWVKYALKDDETASLGNAIIGKKVFTIIWTTTPWTLPASLAVAFNPNEEYVAIESSGEVYIVAAKLANVVIEKCQLANTKELGRFPGRAFEGFVFRHPFLDREILGVVADYVTMDTGSGVVHTAPSHGVEDFETGRRYHLDPKCDVDAAGRIHNGLPEYDGLQVFKANQPIIDLLKSRGALMHEEKLEHSYPHCWRCHHPVIFRTTEQWFIGMETPIGDRTFRSVAMNEIKKIKWDPAWGEERISNMVETRPDWCISRQRVWGVPIAVFVCTACNKPLKDPAVNRRVVELFAKSGADAWYTAESENLAAGAKCECGAASGGEASAGESFKKEADILDVWFESGCSYLVETANEANYPWPSDLYLEGGDQYRGWFMSSLLCAIGARGSSPYKSCATPGWTLDDQGRAMSKSRGNDVDPVDIANRLGGEIVRLWVASVDFREDVVGSENLMQRVADNYRKIRNTFRYILGNLYDFDPARDAVPHGEMPSLDQFMLRQTATLSGQVTDWYDAFAFHRIYHRITEFSVVDLSSFYFDILKDRLYTFGAKSLARRSAQTALWTIGETLARLLAPIMSFTCDEIWGQLPATAGRPDCVHLDTFWNREQIAGKLFSLADWEQADTDWRTLRSFRDEVLKRLEEKRNDKVIGGGLEAQLAISASGELYSVLKRHESELRYLFIVSAVTLTESASRASAAVIEVSKADGSKCERCWNYSTRVGEDAKYPTVCERCVPVLREMGFEPPPAS
jgi:isoleucyl-tRNA synthetase